MAKKVMVQVALQSNGMVNTPGILRWAINGWKFPRDRKSLRKVIMDGFNLTKKCCDDLLSGKVPYTIDERNAAVFEYEQGKYLQPQPDPSTDTQVVTPAPAEDVFDPALTQESIAAN